MATARILVCGGRDYVDREKVFNTLYDVCESRGWKYAEDAYGNWLPDCTIIHGGAKGADTLADEFAVVNWTGLLIFEADWDRYGKAAGFIRNKRMLDEGRPDLVIAFPGGTGTANMVSIAKAAGVEVLEIT